MSRVADAIMQAAQRVAASQVAQDRMRAIAVAARPGFGLRPVGLSLLDAGDARLFRSRHLAEADEKDLNELVQAFGVRSIYDVRSPREVVDSANLYPLGTRTVALNPAADERPKGVNQRLRAGVIKQYGAPEERMCSNYRKYVDEYPVIGAAIRGMATEGVPALVHCVNGKDRTGVICAVALFAAGASWDAILVDYLATNLVNARQMAEEEARLGQGMDAEERAILRSFLEARPAYLAAFFAEAEERYGSLERYLTDGLRLTPAMRVNLAGMVRFDLAPDPTDLEWRQRQRARTRLEDEAYWNAKAPSYDATMANDTFLEDVVGLLDARPGETVLDMGCGTGQVACLLARRGCKVIAADFSEGMLDILRAKLSELPSAEAAAITPVHLSWDDDASLWAAVGAGENAADRVIAIRSFSTEDMAGALRKMTAAARDTATIVMNGAFSPRVMPEVAAAARIQALPDRSAACIADWLRGEGYDPQVNEIRENRRRTFADGQEARTWAVHMCELVAGRALAPAEEMALQQWMEVHLEVCPEGLQLDIPQSSVWAVIRWCTRK